MGTAWRRGVVSGAVALVMVAAGCDDGTARRTRALLSLAVAFGFVLVVIAIAATSYSRHARRRVEVPLAPV